MIKHYKDKVMSYVWNKTERPLKITMWTLVGVGMSIITYGQFYNPQTVTAVDKTGLGDATYREWVDARAEWLQTTDEWQSYIKEEAQSVVNTKAQEAAHTEAQVYKVMTADRIATSTEEITN